MMWLLRIVIFAAIAWLLYRGIRKFLQPPQQNASSKATSSSTTLMRRCADCGIHIAESESTQASGQFFCSEAHRDHWLNQHNNR